MPKIGFIGTGNMAGAIIGGIVKKAVINNEDIAVCDIDPEKLRPYKDNGHPVYTEIGKLVADCGTIFLSVKPQSFAQVLPQVAAAMAKEKVIVSIAAGITANSIKKAMGFDCKVVLAMPNTPLLLGYGATALSRVDPTTAEEFGFVRDIFDSAGVTGVVAPDKMKEIIPVNGSSPAFVYYFAKIIAEKAEAAGIDYDTAMKLFCNTMIGSAHMLLESGKTADELITMVCSPGGSTLAAMKALDDNGFSNTVGSAFDACVKRAEELSTLD